MGPLSHVRTHGSPVSPLQDPRTAVTRSRPAKPGFVADHLRFGGTIEPGSGMGPVAQLVFKTGEVWQPQAG
jgi:hypothetical protein